MLDDRSSFKNHRNWIMTRRRCYKVMFFLDVWHAIWSISHHTLRWLSTGMDRICKYFFWIEIITLDSYSQIYQFSFITLFSPLLTGPLFVCLLSYDEHNNGWCKENINLICQDNYWVYQVGKFSIYATCSLICLRDNWNI